jgi:hypothetical protein
MSLYKLGAFSRYGDQLPEGDAHKLTVSEGLYDQLWEGGMRASTGLQLTSSGLQFHLDA